MARRKSTPPPQPARLFVPLQFGPPSREGGLGPDEDLVILAALDNGRGVVLCHQYWINGPKTAEQVQELRQEYLGSLTQMEAALHNVRPMPGRANEERDAWAADRYLDLGGRVAPVYDELYLVAIARGWAVPDDVKQLDRAIRRELARRQNG